MIWMDSGEPVASVDGITNPRWLKNQIELGERGHLGARGPVKEISERNLIAVMKEKMLQVDLMAKKDESIDTYFQRSQFIYLDEATEDQTRYLDPTVVVQKGIKDTNGNVVVPAGSQFNPLAMRPFTRRLVVFNPNRDEEVEWLKSLPENKRLKDVYIASELDGPRGWEQLQDVQDFIDDNVFLLKSDVWQRFDIERTPSIVTSEGLMFKIEEFAVESKVNESTPTPKAEDEL
jgi:conjugal transfer pilus assembly protein TraW